MYVVLHGDPKNPQSKRQHKIAVFSSSINIPVVAFLGYENSGGRTEIRPTRLVYDFAYHDGSNYHYNFSKQES